MALKSRQSPKSRTKWLTATFWLLTFLFAYMLGHFDWWAWLVYLGAGSALTYFWWKRRHRSRYAVLFGSTCALLAVTTLAMIGWALFVSVSVPVDSVGPRRVVCGSVISPVPTDELKVTIAGSGDAVVQAHSIPQSELERVCSSRLDFRGSRAIDLALISLFGAVRAAGHFVPPRDSSTV